MEQPPIIAAKAKVILLHYKNYCGKVKFIQLFPPKLFAGHFVIFGKKKMVTIRLIADGIRVKKTTIGKTKSGRLG